VTAFPVDLQATFVYAQSRTPRLVTPEDVVVLSLSSAPMARHIVGQTLGGWYGLLVDVNIDHF
jgi:hypothetical protein